MIFRNSLCGVLPDPCAPDEKVVNNDLQFAVDDENRLVAVQLSGVDSVPQKMFYQQAQLQSVSGTEQCVNIGDSAFAGCAKLESVDLSGCASVSNNAFQCCSKIVSVVFPMEEENSYTIGNAAFGDCVSLKSANLSRCTALLGGWSFANCTALETVDLSNITNVAQASFSNCTRLHSLLLPIGSDASYTIEGPSSTTATLGAFRGCVSLKSVDLSRCVSLGKYAFADCSGLTGSIDVSKCRLVGRCAFRNCSEITGSIDLSSCIQIEEYAFQNCEKIESVIFADCQTIENNIFQNCACLANVTIRSSSVLSLGGDAVFSGTKIDSGEGWIYVPDSLVESYKTAPYWSAFADRIKPLSDWNEKEI